jgi:hypothetical protein
MESIWNHPGTVKYWDSFEDSMDVDSDLERRKKQARKATLEFLKSSKERAKKSEEEKKVKKSSSRKPERPSREVVQDNFVLSDGLTEAEEDTQFVRSFFSSLSGHIYISVHGSCLPWFINPQRHLPTTQKNRVLPWCRGWLGLVIETFG